MITQEDKIMENVLARPPERITDIDGYTRIKSIHTDISRELHKLWSNGDYDSEKQDKFVRASEILFNRLEQFSKSYKKVNEKIVNVISRYLTHAGHTYPQNEDVAKMVRILFTHDLIRKKTTKSANNSLKVSYYVVGMHHSVSDGTYLPTKNGKYRQHFSRTCAIQAFKIKNRYIDEIHFLDYHLGLNIPELEDYYTPVFVGSSKYEPLFYCSRQDYKIINEISK
jgi:hypothetical protein